MPRSHRTQPHHDERVQHELREMQTTHDLDEIDDDIERDATLLEWQAPEHTHQPKSPLWYAILLVGALVIIGVLVWMQNYLAIIAVVLATGLLYYFARTKPAIARYRLMVDGVAINTYLYHYRDLQTFNIVYHPGESTLVLIRSKRRFSPLLHLEIGDADPVAIRDILLEFLPEDQELIEPIPDVLARRLGF